MWYYKVDDEEFGPIPAKELKQLVQQGVVFSDTPVRKETMRKFVEAEKVPGLITGVVPEPTRPDSQRRQCGPPGTTDTNPRKSIRRLLPFVALGLLALAWLTFRSPSATYTFTGPFRSNGGAASPDAESRFAGVPSIRCSFDRSAGKYGAKSKGRKDKITVSVKFTQQSAEAYGVIVQLALYDIEGQCIGSAARTVVGRAPNKPQKPPYGSRRLPIVDRESGSARPEFSLERGTISKASRITVTLSKTQP